MTFALELWFSKCGPRTSSLSSPWWLVTNAQAPPQASCMELWAWSPTICFNKPYGGFWYSHLTTLFCSTWPTRTKPSLPGHSSILSLSSPPGGLHFLQMEAACISQSQQDLQRSLLPLFLAQCHLSHCAVIGNLWSEIDWHQFRRTLSALCRPKGFLQEFVFTVAGLAYEQRSA